MCLFWMLKASQSVGIDSVGRPYSLQVRPWPVACHIHSLALDSSMCFFNNCDDKQPGESDSQVNGYHHTKTYSEVPVDSSHSPPISGAPGSRSIVSGRNGASSRSTWLWDFLRFLLNDTSCVRWFRVSLVLDSALISLSSIRNRPNELVCSVRHKQYRVPCFLAVLAALVILVHRGLEEGG